MKGSWTNIGKDRLSVRTTSASICGRLVITQPPQTAKSFLEFLILIAQPKCSKRHRQTHCWRRQGTRTSNLVGNLAHAVSIFRNTPIHIQPKSDPYAFLFFLFCPSAHLPCLRYIANLAASYQVQRHCQIYPVHVGTLALQLPRRIYSTPSPWPLILPLFPLIASGSSSLLTWTTFSTQIPLSVTPDISTSL